MSQRQKEGFALRSLQAVVAVCETGSMSAAAKRLKMTQSAVSQSIQQAEEVVGTDLFDRARRPLRATHAGQILRGRAAGLLRDLEALPQSIVVGHSAPELRLYLVDSFADTVGPMLVRAAAKMAHHLYISQGLNPHIVEALIERRADLVVSSDALDDIDGLTRFPLMSEPFVMFVPEATARGATPQDMYRRMPLIRYNARAVTAAIVDRYLRRVSAFPGRRIEVDNALLMCDLVASGVGWAITTPLHVLQGKSRMNGVAVLPLPGPVPRRDIVMAVREGELATIAPQLANEARRILREDSVPGILAKVPWLRKEIEVF
jgi:DNA-binding transcriptional LysR family regulator